MKQTIKKHIINCRGPRLKQKFLVFESDDWGSIRMESKDALEKIAKSAPKVINSKFTQLDGLEKTQDLELLFELLTKYKDSQGNHPVITALALTSNPDFQKINDNSFEYFSELITKTYKKYDENKLFELWKNEGIVNNLLYPQFHGKEHLHPERYINRVKNSNDEDHQGFINQSIIGGNIGNSRDKNFYGRF